MFKKAKRVNLRRRNESDEDEHEDIQQPQLSQQTSGPAVDEIPFIDSTNNLAGFRTNDIHHDNGFQAYSLKAVKKEKKNRDIVTTTTQVTLTPKASLLSFADEEGNVNAR